MKLETYFLIVGIVASLSAYLDWTHPITPQRMIPGGYFDIGVVLTIGIERLTKIDV